MWGVRTTQLFEKRRGRRSRWCGQPLWDVGLGMDGTLRGSNESRSCLFPLGRPVSRKAGKTKHRKKANEKTAQTRNLARLFAYPLDSWSNLFISTQFSKLAKKQIKQAEKIQLSMEMTPLLQDNSEDTASTSYHLGDEVWKKSARRAKRF